MTVLIPVLDRPERVEPLLESLYSSRGEVPVEAMFLVSPGDDEEEEAVQASGSDYTVVPWEPSPGDYARKINLGFRNMESEWALLGADDLRFHPGWADAALEVCEHAQVIGTNDLGSGRVMRGRHSTHSLVHRDFRGTPDATGCPLHEGYCHNFVDDELVHTAKVRRVWCFAGASVVEHLHPSWGKAQMDETYHRGMAQFHVDGRLFRQRARHITRLGRLA